MRNFVLHFLDDRFERINATLALVWQLEYLSLETGANLVEPVTKVLSILEDKNEGSARANLAIEVAQLETLLVETCQNFATAHPEDQLLKSSLLVRSDSASGVGDGDTSLGCAAAVEILVS